MNLENHLKLSKKHLGKENKRGFTAYLSFTTLPPPNLLPLLLLPTLLPQPYFSPPSFLFREARET
jgi:hypothetical protein